MTLIKTRLQSSCCLNMFVRMHVWVCILSMFELFAEIKYVKTEDRYKLTFFFVWQHEILALLCKTYRSSDEIFSDAIEYLPIFLQAVFIDFFLTWLQSMVKIRIVTGSRRSACRVTHEYIEWQRIWMHFLLSFFAYNIWSVNLRVVIK